jgi:murein DD-endopeptidase MepM/ murein hydrolase activator NlpD
MLKRRNKKEQKVTVLIFEDGNLSEVKTKRLNVTKIKKILLLPILYFFISLISFYFVFSMFSERKSLLSYKFENEVLKNKLVVYGKELEEFQTKLAVLDELEKKIKKLTPYNVKDVSNIAVGGRELELDKGLFAVAERKEKQFFDKLNERLVSLSSELEKKEISLSELVDFLEEQRLMVMSTPSIWPVKGWLSSKFGYRISPFSGRKVFHEGIDIAARYGAPVRATAKGIVIYAGYKVGYGKLVTIDHGFGYVTRYGHNSKVLVKVGDKVEKGQVISKVGNTGKSTGPHVHYEVLVNGVPVNPLKFIVSNNEQY